MRNHHGNDEIQGQRLSAYTSGNVSKLTKSYTKNRGYDKSDLSKKKLKIETLKCSCDIGHLSNRVSVSQTDTNEASTVKHTASTTTNTINKDLSATTHIISNHRHNVSLKTKSTDIHLKCSCNIVASNTDKLETALDRKQNILLIEEKKSKILRQIVRKEKKDVATSPQLPLRHAIAEDIAVPDFDNSTQAAAVFGKNNETVNFEKNISKVLMASSIHPSPRREIPTRNAATSPHHIDFRKRDECRTKITEMSAASAVNMPVSKLTLEKSKSLNETRPQRQLRTTRSLSPRPPVRQQQAIIISDENDIVVEVTRSKDFAIMNTDDSDRLNVRKALSKIIHKAQSENTSPNLHEGDAFFAGDQYAINMSTGCLVYLPSDPWMKMTDNVSTPKKIATESSLGRISKIRTQSNVKNDPWVYRKTDTSNLPTSARPALSRQSQSLASSIQMDHKSGPKSRPKLQRCKSPAVFDDAFLCTDLLITATNNELKIAVSSPQKSSKPSTNKRTQPPNCLLNVSNTNSMLQPRHSFSSLSKKDDELQLNIRRLSEQMKSSTITSSTTAVSTADFSTYLKHCSIANKSALSCDLSPNVISNLTPPSTATKRDADVVLETTC